MKKSSGMIPEEKLDVLLFELLMMKKEYLEEGQRREDTTEKKNGKLFIGEELIRLGIPANLRGYRYMITAIEMVMEDESVLEGITKILYPAVAKQCGATPQRVEKAIRHAIEAAWTRSKNHQLKEIFGYMRNRESRRPTNSQFIAVIGQYIKSKK